MKHPILIMAGGIALAGLGYLVYSEARRKSAAAAAQSNIAQMTSDVPVSQMKFKGFNFNLVLNTHTKQALPEVTALQHMINSYYNGEKSIDVTGVFDQQTANAVRDITGQSSVTLAAFKNVYLNTKRTDKVANELLKSLTIAG